MKKLMCVLAVSAMALMGCDTKNANAQNDGTVVGNPDSDNVLIIQEGYEAVIPAAAVQMPNGQQMNNPVTQPNNSAGQPSPVPPASAGSASGANAGAITVDETVSGMTDGNGNGVYEIDESVYQE